MARRRRSTSSAEMKPPCASPGRGAAPAARRLSIFTVAIAITPTAIAARPSRSGAATFHASQIDYRNVSGRRAAGPLAGDAPASGGWSSVHAYQVVGEHARLLVLLGRGGVVLATEEELV